MPTKRTRRSRTAELVITQAAVDAFRRALPLQDQYVDCLTSENECKRAPKGQHCPECTTYLDACRTLAAELRLRPWQPDPLCPGDAASAALRASLDELVWPTSKAKI